MKDLIKNLLAIGVTVGFSDREAFVAKVSGMISDYQKDPAQADKWAKAIAHYLEETKDDYRMQRAVENSITNSHLPDKRSIEDLTKAILHLSQILNDKRGNNV